MEEIDIKSLLNLFWKKRIIIIIITIIGLLIGLVYNLFLTTPKYKAKTSFLLAQSGVTENETDKITTTDINLNTKLLQNYTQLIKSDTVLYELPQRLNMNINVEQLKGNINIEKKTDTEFVEISVTDTEKQRAPLIANAIMEILIEKVKQIYKMDNIHIVSKATESSKPYNINPIKYGAIGAFIGAIISVLIILCKNMLDDTVKDETTVKQQLGIKTLAKIQDQTKIHGNLKASYIEEIKSIRTNLQLVKRNKQIKSISVTSTCPGEGKSWIVCNLALAFAKADYKVCIVDADMRRGIIHSKFFVEQTPGLSDLIKSDDIEYYELLSNKYIKETKIEGISVIPCGSITGDSSELLMSKKMTKLIDMLKQNFDIVIFDSTPSTLVTDAVVLSSLVETNIIVTEHEKTKMKDLKYVKELIESVGGDIAGIVINKASDENIKAYYGNVQISNIKNKKH
ncbi:MAG: polysaccharide biosynthesis tyrosine autokinase [Clostridia bacterium]|nr:polysaccharide biosynthesis tyrosine autokinase [Clostridia bacterium]